jgi:hypothetical protein
MHARELANMALTASSVAESMGFEATAKAFSAIAAEAYLVPDGYEVGRTNQGIPIAFWPDGENGMIFNS